MSAKMTPSAVLVIQNGMTKLVSVKNQDTVSKVLDMVPDLVNKFVASKADDITSEAMDAANDILKESKSEDQQKNA